MEKPLKATAVFLLCLLVLSGCNGAGLAGATNPARVANPKRFDLRLPAVDGKPFRISSLVGKVVLVSFFNTGCVPCTELFSRFRRVQAAYGDNRVAIVAVSVDKSRNAMLVKTMAETLGYRFPILLAGSNRVGGIMGYRISLVPTTLVLDRKGYARFVHRKMVTTRLLAREVRSLLK